MVIPWKHYPGKTTRTRYPKKMLPDSALKRTKPYCTQPTAYYTYFLMASTRADFCFSNTSRRAFSRAPVSVRESTYCSNWATDWNTRHRPALTPAPLALALLTEPSAVDAGAWLKTTIRTTRTLLRSKNEASGSFI